jgi:hypothetical protein
MLAPRQWIRKSRTTPKAYQPQESAGRAFGFRSSQISQKDELNLVRPGREAPTLDNLPGFNLAPTSVGAFVLMGRMKAILCAGSASPPAGTASSPRLIFLTHTRVCSFGHRNRLALLCQLLTSPNATTRPDYVQHEAKHSSLRAVRFSIGLEAATNPDFYSSFFIFSAP